MGDGRLGFLPSPVRGGQRGVQGDLPLSAQAHVCVRDALARLDDDALIRRAPGRVDREPARLAPRRRVGVLRQQPGRQGGRLGVRPVAAFAPMEQHRARRVAGMPRAALERLGPFRRRRTVLPVALQHRGEQPVHLRHGRMFRMAREELPGGREGVAVAAGDELGVDQLEHEFRLAPVPRVGHHEALGRADQRERPAVVVGQVGQVQQQLGALF